VVDELLAADIIVIAAPTPRHSVHAVKRALESTHYCKTVFPEAGKVM
jgi:hypothetical protein